MPHSYYLSRKYGPISIGLSSSKADTNIFGYGIGRTITVTYSCNILDADGSVIDEKKQQIIETWIIDEWEDKILVDDMHPKIDMLKTLNELGAIALVIMPSTHTCNLKLSCKYLYDKLNMLIQLISEGRCCIVGVEISEQAKSFDIKTERYFTVHK